MYPCLLVGKNGHCASGLNLYRLDPRPLHGVDELITALQKYAGKLEFIGRTDTEANVIRWLSGLDAEVLT